MLPTKAMRCASGGGFKFVGGFLSLRDGGGRGHVLRGVERF